MPREVPRLTPEGRETLESELKTLVSVQRREVADRIHSASEAGGTVDNAEYEEAINERTFVEGRISDLEQILSQSVVSETKKRRKKGAVIEFGSSVTVSPDKGAKRLYKVVGSAEAAPLEGKISESSPVGRPMMGHKVGDEVEVETPAGVVKLTVTKIS
jgi:transcription elongation factor GreA